MIFRKNSYCFHSLQECLLSSSFQVKCIDNVSLSSISFERSDQCKIHQSNFQLLSILENHRLHHHCPNHVSCQRWFHHELYFYFLGYLYARNRSTASCSLKSILNLLKRIWLLSFSFRIELAFIALFCLSLLCLPMRVFYLYLFMFQDLHLKMRHRQLAHPCLEHPQHNYPPALCDCTTIHHHKFPKHSDKPLSLLRSVTDHILTQRLGSWRNEGPAVLC